MQISWFRPDPPDSDAALDAMRPLVEAAARQHDLTLVDRRSAHDVPWRWHQGGIDLTVYELTGTAGDAYMWPYLVRYPGLAILTSRRLTAGHAADLLRRGRRDDLDAESRVSRAGHGVLGGLILPASRAIALPEGMASDASPDRRPGTLLRFTPGLPRPAVHRTPRAGALRAGLLHPSSRVLAVAERAAARARSLGADVDLLVSADASDLLAHADTLLALDWPPRGGLAGDVLAAMALGIPPVLFETADTATLPAVNPQTGLSRDAGPGAPAPVAISLDPRDEEHSLMLALRRLAADDAWRAALASAGRTYVEARHDASVTGPAFVGMLERAASLPLPATPPSAPPQTPAPWPAHFLADTSEGARRILDAFGLGVDILAERPRPGVRG